MMLALTVSSLLALAPEVRAHGSPPAVHDAQARAWAVVHGDRLWVCWTEAPDCWTEVTLARDAERPSHQLDGLDGELSSDFIVDEVTPEPAAALGAGRWRLGFWGPRTLWVEVEGERWRVDRGQRRAQVITVESPLPLSRPQVHGCSDDGQVPAVVMGRLRWRPAPSCGASARAPGGGAASSSCVARTEAARVRRPTPLRIRMGLQLSAVQKWSRHDNPDLGIEVARVQSSAGVELLAVAELGFDLAQARRDARARVALRRRPRQRALPPVADGPLALARQRALAAVVCEEPSP